ncbi:hypothetical protein PCORN_15221 [Listeria cornellensis FSL F6-0969]|uniref:Uncharacterized protein n=2 Tax=Listeria cornellensis TaxID=1494961 RepID=W7BKF5_9LIST|nr:hypothetical protein PCORN_15221 [Listeria cornellensis FSL F6-0969]
MFIDTEQEVDAVVSNDILNGNGIKMKFNINDTDGAFYNNGGTGTTSSALSGGGGTYRYKWSILDLNSKLGAGSLFGSFSGNSTTVPTAGNLEFKTLVKDQVLKQIGPASGDFAGADGAPLSVANVRQLILDNQKELDAAYKLDAAFMGARTTIYKDWLATQVKVQAQVPDRVKYNLEMWTKYGMAHTLQNVSIIPSGSGVVLNNPNANTDVYYTTDGTDPMGADGVVSSKATKYTAGTVLDKKVKLTVRAFATNNWGPMIDNGLAAEQAQKEDTATKAVQALFTNDNIASGTIKKETDQATIDAAQKAVDAVADLATRSVLQNNLNTAKELLANRGKTSGAITTNDFIIGTDSYIKGTYTGDVTKIGLEVNNTPQQIINATGSPYQYYAKGKINAPTDQVNIIGYDKDGNELQKTKVNVQKPTAGQITLNPFYLGKDNYVTGQFSGDVAKISLTVNDAESTKITVTTTNFQYYANKLIRNMTDKVKLTAYDINGKILATQPVIIAKEAATVGAITSLAPFKIGKDNYVTGQFSGDIAKISMTVNNAEGTKITVSAPDFKYYANNVIRNLSDTAKLTAYDNVGKVLDTKTITVLNGISLPGSIDTIAPFKIGKDNYITGTFTGDIVKVELQINKAPQQRINVKDYIIKYYAKTNITNTNDVIELVGYNTAGDVVSTKAVPVTSANGGVTVNPYVLGDGYVKGQFTSDVARISLTVNNAKKTTISVPPTGSDFQYYAKPLIKNRTDTVSLTAYDSLGGEIQTVSVPIL